MYNCTISFVLFRFYLCLNNSLNSSSVIFPSPSASSLAIRASVFFWNDFLMTNMMIAINYLIHLCAQLAQLRHGYIAGIVSVDRLCYQWMKSRIMKWKMTYISWDSQVLAQAKMSPWKQSPPCPRHSSSRPPCSPWRPRTSWRRRWTSRGRSRPRRRPSAPAWTLLGHSVPPQSSRGPAKNIFKCLKTNFVSKTSKNCFTLIGPPAERLHRLRTCEFMKSFSSSWSSISIALNFN